MGIDRLPWRCLFHLSFLALQASSGINFFSEKLKKNRKNSQQYFRKTQPVNKQNVTFSIVSLLLTFGALFILLTLFYDKIYN